MDKGYTKKIGASDALHAEMLGLYLGIDGLSIFFNLDVLGVFLQVTFCF